MRFSTLIARNLFRRGVRTLLTVRGLAIGVSAVESLLGDRLGFGAVVLRRFHESKGIDSRSRQGRRGRPAHEQPRPGGSG